MKDLSLGWKTYCWEGRLIVGMEDFLLGWKTYCWEGRLLVGMEDLLLGWKTYCWEGRLIVGKEDSTIKLKLRTAPLSSHRHPRPDTTNPSHRKTTKALQPQSLKALNP